MSWGGLNNRYLVTEQSLFLNRGCYDSRVKLRGSFFFLVLIKGNRNDMLMAAAHHSGLGSGCVESFSCCLGH